MICIVDLDDLTSSSLRCRMIFAENFIINFKFMFYEKEY